MWSLPLSLASRNFSARVNKFLMKIPTLSLSSFFSPKSIHKVLLKSHYVPTSCINCLYLTEWLVAGELWGREEWELLMDSRTKFYKISSISWRQNATHIDLLSKIKIIWKWNFLMLSEAVKSAESVGGATKTQIVLALSLSLVKTF